jgi:hypothetical protein
MDPTNPDCDNYDPCYGKTQPSAKFIIEQKQLNEQLKSVWIADSTFGGFEMRFRSEYTDSKYKHTWYVGSEVFYGTVTPIRDFRQTPRPQNITVSHVLEYTPDLQCFPDDDGKDSVAQDFRLIALWDELKVFGTFRGVFQGSLDSFDFNFQVLDINDQPAYFSNGYRVRSINFHNNGDTLYSDATANRLNYSGLVDHYAIATYPHFLTLTIAADNTIIMNYRWFDNGYDNYTVVGRKIN